MSTVRTKDRIPPFDPQQLVALARILGEADRGLTASQIGHLLASTGIPDRSPSMASWRRLYSAFDEFQNQHLIGNHVVVFIQKAMNSASSPDRPEPFRGRREELNRILARCGMTLGEDGKMRRVTRAKSLDEALERSNRLQSALRQRNVHPDVLTCCRPETVKENCSDAILEAIKGVADEIRQLSGHGGDGVDLVEKAFGLGQGHRPSLAINQLETETERGEQRGFVGMLKGLYGLCRNPLAHEPRIDWEINEHDALDILTIISLIRRKLDKAVRLSAAA